MNDIGILKTADYVNDCRDLADVSEKLIAQTFSPFDAPFTKPAMS